MKVYVDPRVSNYPRIGGECSEEVTIDAPVNEGLDSETKNYAM
jgi:hypothetical protein